MPAPANKGERYPADVLRREEVDRLVLAARGKPLDAKGRPKKPSSIGLRNSALIAAMYRGGLRVSEALALRPGDVDLATGKLHVRRGKGDRARRVAIDNGALRLLGEWVERRRSLGFDDRKAYLFCNVRSAGDGGPLASSYLRRLLPKLAEAAQIPKRVHPHMLRHTRAAELAAEGVPVNVIQAALGHSSLATTSTYLAHIAPEQVYEAMRAGGWKSPKAA